MPGSNEEMVGYFHQGRQQQMMMTQQQQHYAAMMSVSGGGGANGTGATDETAEVKEVVVAKNEEKVEGMKQDEIVKAKEEEGDNDDMVDSD